jgi:hypothetical protein
MKVASSSQILRALIAAAALGTAPALSEPAGNRSPQQPPAQNTTTPEPIDIMPLVDVSAPFRGEASLSPVGGYVRFYICEVSQCAPGLSWSGGQRRYAADYRPWYERMFVNRNNIRLLSLKLSVREPNIGAAATMASSSFESRRGQSWTTELNGRRYLTPYLRVDPGTVVGVEVSLNASRQVEANVSRTVLDIVERAAALAQPTGDLVTELNEERFERTADFVDEAISSLFGQSIGEKASHEFGVADWGAQLEIGEIRARFPMGLRVVDHSQQREIGRWQVRASVPLVSIFSDVPLYSEANSARVVDRGQCSALAAGPDQQACIAFRMVTPQRVLNLSVGENVTLGQAILADAAVLAAINAGAGSDAQLCSAIAARAEALGLNRYDSAAAVWAMQEAGRVRSAALLQARCAAGTLATRVIVPAQQ